MLGTQYNTTININGKTAFCSRYNSPFGCILPPAGFGCFGFGFGGGFGCDMYMGCGPNPMMVGMGIGAGYALGDLFCSSLPAIGRGIGKAFSWAWGGVKTVAGWAWDGMKAVGRGVKNVWNKVFK